MSEINELQPAPEKEVKDAQSAPEITPEETAAPQAEPAPATVTQADENNVDNNEQNTAEATTEATDETTTEQPIYETKEQVVERLKAIEAEGTGGEKNELDLLKQVFYKLQRSAQMAALQAFVAAGGDPNDWRADIDTIEENFKAAFSAIKQRRAELAQEAENKKAENLEKKQTIIERIKELATSPEEANQHFDEFKQLQAQWKELGAVPPEKATEIWKNYQLYVEQFYDLLKLNSEAREYDFKKNLTAKERLIELAEKLADEEDVVVAFNKLQALHAEYKEIGPVAKELRDQIWERFKAASTVINKRHQEHFESIKAQEEENLQKKTALCEQVENIHTENIKSFAEWDELTKQVLELQAQWKTIGYAPHKQNALIFDRFRTAADAFFRAKAEFYREAKEEQSEHLEAKRRIVEEAEALKDSTEWRKTTDKLIDLQKQWKEIGAVPRKYSEQLWKRFSEACDAFFDAKQAANAGQRAEQQQNLEAKKNIIEQLRQLAEDKANATIEKVRELQAQWNEIGHVPFRDKDKIYAEYRAAADELYKSFNAGQARRRLEGFQKSVRQAVANGESTLSRERERLMRIFDNRKAEIQTYENNLNFLNAKSKSGNSLVTELNRKVEKLREELDLLTKKIKAIDAEMRAPKDAPTTEE